MTEAQIERVLSRMCGIDVFVHYDGGVIIICNRGEPRWFETTWLVLHRDIAPILASYIRAHWHSWPKAQLA